MKKQNNVFSVKAYAKINLFLNVLKKNNNLHLLESLVCFVNLYDEIKIIKDKKFSIVIKGPFKSYLNEKENIIKETVFNFSDLIGVEPRYKIFLNKKIPVAAGLGGGSSDAAAVIRGICKLNRHNLTNNEIYKFAQTIGSDVPVCLYNKSIFFSGYGEILTPCPKLPNFSLILINPLKKLSTKKVFKEYDKLFPNIKGKKINLDNLNKKNFFSWILGTQNDLSEPAKKIIPEIKEIINILDSIDSCLFSRMSGSGPTVFGLFKNILNARKIQKTIKKNHPNWWSVVGDIKT